MTIRNLDELASHGEASSRRVALETMEAALRGLDASRVIRSLLRLDGDTLRVGDRRWELAPGRRLFP